jgi:hypothetical protein
MGFNLISIIAHKKYSRYSSGKYHKILYFIDNPKTRKEKSEKESMVRLWRTQLIALAFEDNP